MQSVHDHTIISYEVNFESSRLIFNTQYETNEIAITAEVVFSGYLAHSFDFEMRNSIIFDIEEYSYDLFFKKEHILLDNKHRYAWPIHYESKEELRNFLLIHKYKVFNISSSIGLCGIVFAKQLDIIETGNNPKEPISRIILPL